MYLDIGIYFFYLQIINHMFLLLLGIYYNILTESFEYDRSAAKSSSGFKRGHGYLVLCIGHQVAECHGIGVDRYLRHYPVTDQWQNNY